MINIKLKSCHITKIGIIPIIPIWRRLIIFNIKLANFGYNVNRIIYKYFKNKGSKYEKGVTKTCLSLKMIIK